MYTVTVTRDFVAQHYLTVPNPGPEGTLHSHHFEVEIHLEGPDLNEFGYLVDIDDLDTFLDSIEDRYRDTTLNDLPEFADTNPSVEHFAERISSRFRDAVTAPNVDTVRVRVWEDESAGAAFDESVE